MANCLNLQTKQFLFILGGARSGTSWLQLMVAAHPLVAATTELRLFNAYVAPWLKAWEDEAAITSEGMYINGLPAIWEKSRLHQVLSDFLGQVYGEVVASKPSATHVLDKHPGYSQYVETIDCFLPSAKYVHIIRDGRDVAVSMLAASKDIGWWPEAKLDEFGRKWRSYVIGARQASAFAGRYMEVRYEELLERPTEVLAEVFRFSQLEADTGCVEQIVQDHKLARLKRDRTSLIPGAREPEGHYRTGRAGGWTGEFSAVDRYLFDRVCGQLLIDLGYAQRGWWSGTNRDRLMLPAIGATRLALRRAQAAARVLLARPQSTPGGGDGLV